MMRRDEDRAGQDAASEHGLRGSLDVARDEHGPGGAVAEAQHGALVVASERQALRRARWPRDAQLEGGVARRESLP
jgi:hypothetical protein